MASFSAELRVAGRVYPLLRCDYRTFQDMDGRGRVNAKVRHSPVEMLLDAPRGGFLAVWGPILTSVAPWPLSSTTLTAGGPSKP